MKYYQSIRRMAFLIAAIAVICGSVSAQIPGVTVLPPQLNNPSPYLSDWQSRASTAIVTVMNTGSPFSAKVWVEFFLNGTRVAFSQPAKLPVTPIAKGTNTFNGEQLVPLSSVKFESNVDQSSQRAGRIPDGRVCLRVHVLNIQTNQESVSQDGCSIVLSYSPAQLILPADNSELCKLGSNNVIDKRNGQPVPIFQWSPIVPAPQTPVTYHFAIYEVLPGQAPIAAFRGAYALFQRDLTNLTNLLWPTEYFLPEKGKLYVWSVRALDDKGNPFVLTNDGWATPFTFTVAPNCDQSGSNGNLSDVLSINPPIMDFGSVKIGTPSESRQISLTNIGTGTISLHPLNIVPPGENAGFTVDLQPSLFILEPGMSTALNVVFKPTTIGAADGSMRVATDGGSALVTLKGQGIDAASSTISIQSPQGGDNLNPGSLFNIKFTASDNNTLDGYNIQFSTDGGITFKDVVTPINDKHRPPLVQWNIPLDLQSSQGVIKISALDNNGNQVIALSGVFSIGAASGQNGNQSSDSSISSDSKSRNTNLTDTYLMHADQTSFTFIPLALEILSPEGTAIDFPKDFNVLSRTTQGKTLETGTIDIPEDLIDLSKQKNSGGGINIEPTIPNSTKNHSTGNQGGGYAVQYRETEFDLITPGKGTFTYNDAKSGAVNGTIIYPENSVLIDADSYPRQENKLSVGNSDGSSTSDGPNILGSMVKISSLNIGASDSWISAYFNPKEISMDKPAPWQHHRNSEGDAPTLEFTAGAPMHLELMFDCFEANKSVKPDLQKFLQWLGVQNGKYGRVKVQFHWDREKKQEMYLTALSVEYTMFLPDGKPCRAAVTLGMTPVDSIPPHIESRSGHIDDTHGGTYESMLFNSNIGPQTLQLLQSNPSPEPVLRDPLFADQERKLRTAFMKNLSGVSAAAGNFKRKPLKGITKTPGDFNLAHRFSVEIDGVLLAGVHSLEGFETESDVVEYKDGEDATMHTRPGNHQAGKITITKDWSNTSEWYKWRKAVIDGKVERKSISIIILNDAGEESGRVNFFECYPVKHTVPDLNAKNSGHATEKMEISYEGKTFYPYRVHYTGEMKTFNGVINGTMNGTMNGPLQTSIILPITLGGKSANVLLIGLLLPPANPTLSPTIPTNLTDIHSDLSGWNWQAYVPGRNTNGGFGGGGSGGSNTRQNSRTYTSGKYAIELDGVKAGWVSEVEGGELIRNAPPQSRDAELAKEGFTAKKHIGNLKYEDISLKCDATMEKPMLDWIASSLDMKFTRKSGAIIMGDYNYKETGRLNFTNGFITEIGFPALDAASKDAAKMSIKFQPEMSNFVKVDSSKPVNINLKDTKVQKTWTPSNFRLKIDGLDCSKVNKVDAITIKQKNVENAVGEMREIKREPIHIDYPNLLISLPESHLLGFKEWYEKSVIAAEAGKGAQKNGSLEYLAEDGTPLFTLSFNNLGIVKMTPEKVESGGDNIKKIKIQMSVEEMKFDYNGGL